MRSLSFIGHGSPARLVTLVAAFALFATSPACAEDGFTTIFNGKNLDGWTLVKKKGPGYIVKDDMLVCPADGGGNLFTEKTYANFDFRFDVRLSDGGNNGVGIRSTLDGHPAFDAIEIQVLDNYAKRYANIRPAQFCGSIYDVVPAKQGALKKAGEWNTMQIRADGPHITVTLNDEVIVDANVDDVTDPAVLKKHPGLRRKSGHIGFLGHATMVEFRNIRIKELP
ncbi:hypothetical protein Pan216_45430 [Planctomycetes bacterium Pan216]|uniref:3-keto-alpha-glucoside-1,2-lyase/3-keto-2-hydroxy-glucal hydratase domain-containing protein n=1 Tax=Kolteria novifilia TaxID=2527975 RepID=A0A518B9K0_9BACT|nr:hypothetical protein Pan216_45430 [Planctomycetes bacterium Pan216]